MEILLNLISIYFAFRITKTIFYIFRAIKNSNKQGEDVNLKKDTNLNNEVNNWSSKINSIKEETHMVGKVKDEICGTTIPREEAYIVVKDGKPNYFCSWECRQKFIDINKKENLA